MKKQHVLSILLCLSCVTSKAIAQSCLSPCEILLRNIETEYYSVGTSSINFIAQMVDSLSYLAIACDSCNTQLYDASVWLGYAARMSNKYREQKYALDKQLETMPRIVQVDSSESFIRYSETQMRLAHYYLNIGAHQQAKFIYEHVIDTISDPFIDDPLIYRNYNISNQKLGEIEFLQHNFHAAKRYFEYAINIELERSKLYNTQPTTFSIHARLGQIYLGLKEHETANIHFLKSTAYIQDYLIKNNTDKINLYAYLFIPPLIAHANNAILLNNFSEAKEILSIIDKISIQNNQKNIDYYLTLLCTTRQQHQSDSFNIIYDRAKELLDSTSAQADIRNRLLLEKALKAQAEGHDEVALKLFSDIRNQISLLKQSHEAWPPYYFTVDQHYLELLIKLEKNQSTIDFLNELTVNISNRLNANMILEDHVTSLEAYRTSIRHGLNFLFSEADNHHHLIFDLMEVAKSISLYKQLAGRNNLSQRQDSLVLEYKKIKAIVAELKLQMAQVDSTIELANKVFKLEEQSEDMLKVIQALSKGNHAILRKTTLAEFLAYMSNNETVLLYFYDDIYYYTFKIAEGEAEVIRTPSKRVNNLVQDFHNEISVAGNISTIKNIGQKLHSLLGLKHVGSNTLVLSTDGLLNALPFEALVNDEQNFLIESIDCRYISSARIDHFLKPRHSQKKINKIIKSSIFAPTFGPQFNALKYIDEEVRHIKQTTGAQVFSDKFATKKFFVTEVTDFDLVHIASHAKVDTVSDQLSYIAFTYDTTASNNRLYFDEILSLDIKSELVTLSACETGLGTNYTSEGIQSLARNFLLAGSKAVVGSLWTISDQTTSEIMTSFYTHLYRGLSKSEALSIAKKEYIRNNSGQDLHPYYWAGIILYGNDAELVSTSTLSWIKVVGLILLICLIARLWYKKRRLA